MAESNYTRDLSEGRIRRVVLLGDGRIGDTTFYTPLIRGLRERLPNAELVMVTNPYSTPVVKHNPHLNRVWSVAFKTRNPLTWWSSRRTLADAFSEQFDLGIVFNRKPRLLALLQEHNCRYTAGHAEGCRMYIPIRQDRHRIDSELELARMLGCAPREPWPEVAIAPEAAREVEAFLSAHGVGPEAPVIGIHPGCNYAVRRRRRLLERLPLRTARHRKLWPGERFAEVARRMHRHTRLPIILTGLEQERPILEGIAAASGVEPLLGCFRPETLPALVARLNFLICIDSGPMHIAAARRVPLVALFGPTSSLHFGPYAPEEWVCVIRPPESVLQTMPPEEVITSLTVDAVSEKAIAHWDRVGNPNLVHFPTGTTSSKPDQNSAH